MIDKYRNVLYAKRWKINVILSHFFVFFSCIDFCNWSTETPFFDHWLHRSFVLRHKLWSSFDLSGEEFCIIEKYTGQEPSGFSFKRLWGPTASKFDKTLLNWTLIANPWVGYRLFYGGGGPKVYSGHTRTPSMDIEMSQMSRMSRIFRIWQNWPKQLKKRLQSLEIQFRNLFQVWRDWKKVRKGNLSGFDIVMLLILDVFFMFNVVWWSWSWQTYIINESLQGSQIFCHQS